MFRSDWGPSEDIRGSWEDICGSVRGLGAPVRRFGTLRGDLGLS